MAGSPRWFKVLTEYQAVYPEPFVVQAGDSLTAIEKESEWPGWIWGTDQHGEGRWVPEVYMERQGETLIALRDYDATELTVHTGEEVIAGEEAAGWIWCTKQEGQSGWVPAEHLASKPAVQNEPLRLTNDE